MDKNISKHIEATHRGMAARTARILAGYSSKPEWLQKASVCCKRYVDWKNDTNAGIRGSWVHTIGREEIWKGDLYLKASGMRWASGSNPLALHAVWLGQRGKLDPLEQLHWDAE